MMLNDRRAHRFALWLAIAVAASAYIGFSRLSSGPATFLTAKYTEALVAGQFYLQNTDNAGAQAQLYDASPYNGRYYLYFGVVPFATVLAPVLAATGRQLTDNEAILGYTLGTILCLGWLLGDLARRYFPRAGPGALAGAVLLVAFGSGGLLLMRNPNIYELVAAAAWFHGGLTLCFASAALHDPRRTTLWLALAGLNAGLVVGCRPTQVGVAAVTFVFILLQHGAGPRSWWPRWRSVFLALLPLCAVGTALACYNWVRFDNPLEFGFRYQPSMAEQVSQGILSWRYIPTNLWLYLVGLPYWTGWFPFFEWPMPVPFAAPPGYFRIDQVYGLIATCPAVILATALVARERLQAALPRALPAMAVACGLLHLLVLCTFDCAVYRYKVDFLPYFVISAAWGVLSLGNRTNPWWKGGGAVLVIFSLLASFCEANALYELSRTRNPAFFDGTARLFNFPRSTWERMRDTPLTKTRIRLQLPLDRYGHNEPLLVTGYKGLRNFIYFNYAGPGFLRVGYEANGLGGPVSDFIPINYHEEITIEVILGNRWPPMGAAVYGNLPLASVERLHRRLAVTVNGKPALDAFVPLHPNKGIFFWGQSPDDAAFGSAYSGKLMEIAEIALEQPAAFWAEPTAPVPPGTR